MGKPQWKLLEEHLLKQGSISQSEAMTVYGIKRLASRIHDLRKKGLAITSELRRDPIGTQYSRYFLER